MTIFLILFILLPAFSNKLPITKDVTCNNNNDWRGALPSLKPKIVNTQKSINDRFQIQPTKKSSKKSFPATTAPTAFNQLKINQKLSSLKVISQSEKGDGIVYYTKDHEIHIPNALLNETVTVSITKVHRSFSEAELLSVQKESSSSPSLSRTQPVCEIAMSCGGCQLQYQNYPSQLIFKKFIIQQAFGRYNQSSSSLNHIIIDDVIPSTSLTNYRNKAQFAFQRTSSSQSSSLSVVNIGLYKKKSHEVINTNYCDIQHPHVNTIIHKLHSFFQRYNSNSIINNDSIGTQNAKSNIKSIMTSNHNSDGEEVSVYDESTHQGSFRHVVIRVGFETNEVMVCLVSATPMEKTKYLREFVDCILSCNNEIVCDDVNDNDSKIIDISDDGNGKNINYNKPNISKSTAMKVTSILFNHNPSTGDEVLNMHPSSTITLYGKDSIEDVIAGIRVKVSLFSFTQSNPRQAAVLYHTVLELCQLKGNEKIYDLFCGIGIIGLFLSKQLQLLNNNNNNNNNNNDNNNNNSISSTINTNLANGGYVVGVEDCREAVEDANYNKNSNNIHNIEFIHGKAEEVLLCQIGTSKNVSRREGNSSTDDDINATTETSNSNNQKQQQQQQQQPNGDNNNNNNNNEIVILNPPRKGVHLTLLDEMHVRSIPKVIYVSCNPHTLARDLDILTSSPLLYKIIKVQPVDMFPHTIHVETVVLLHHKDYNSSRMG